MIGFTLRAASALASLALAAGCAGHPAPSPSKVTTVYKLKVDDAVRETASVQLVTTKEVLISADCAPMASGDAAAADRSIAGGMAARLPANVTLYTTPYDPVTVDSLPDVVTDDGYGGKLCTPHSFRIVGGT
ncbi:MAG TPA: hypothetical protein VK760_12330 [Candidatus Acidoferrales bacterium]|jgi:hypothetical protein|nr:hypothetical protein [Candidatus Acidoferrales bacterium]